MKVRIKDEGGHVKIYIGSDAVGYFDCYTAHARDAPNMPMGPNDVYLRYVQVDPEYRGTGVADVAYLQLEALLKKRGLKTIVTWPMPFREEWCERNGYRPSPPSRRNPFMWEKNIG